MSALPDEAPAWAVRLEAKVDVALATHGARIEENTRDLAALRSEASRVHRDAEHRITALESRVVVTPRMLAACLAGVVAALGPITHVFQLLVN